MFAPEDPALVFPDSFAGPRERGSRQLTATEVLVVCIVRPQGAGEHSVASDIACCGAMNRNEQDLCVRWWKGPHR